MLAKRLRQIPPLHQRIGVDPDHQILSELRAVALWLTKACGLVVLSLECVRRQQGFRLLDLLAVLVHALLLSMLLRCRAGLFFLDLSGMLLGLPLVDKALGRSSCRRQAITFRAAQTTA